MQSIRSNTKTSQSHDVLFPATGTHYANFDIWMINLIARNWLAGLVTVFCAFVMHGTLSLRSTSGERTQCKLNTRKAWVLMGQVPDTERSRTQAPQSTRRAVSPWPCFQTFSVWNWESCLSIAILTTSLINYALGLTYAPCTFFGRNSLLRLVIRMQTIIQNTLMSIWCLGPKPPATPKPPPEPPLPTNGPPLPPGKMVSYHDHWPSFKKDSWTTMANFRFKSSLL